MANAFLVEPLAMAAITATNTAAGFDPAVLGNDLIGVVWQSTSVTSIAVTVDLGADTALDSIIVLGAAGVTSATLTIAIATAAQGSGFAGAWSGSAATFLAGTVMPRSGKGKALWTAPSGAPAAGRYVRLTIANSAATVVSLGRVIVGQRVTLARNFSFGAAFGVRSLGSVDYSVSGVPLVRRGGKLRTLSLTFSAVYKDEVEGKVRPLNERCGIDTPIAIITDPDVHAERQNRIYFGHLSGDPGEIWARAGSFQAAFALTALD